MNRLVVTTLIDNNIYDKRAVSEFGFSMIIEYKNRHKIMFDVGYSNLFLTNAKRLGIDLNSVTEFVLTHRHKSHTGGVPHLLRLLKAENPFIIEKNYFEPFLRNSGGSLVKSQIDYVDTIKQHLKRYPTYYIDGEYRYANNILFLKLKDQLEQTKSLNKQNVREAVVMIIESVKGIFVFFGASYRKFPELLDYLYEKYSNRAKWIFGGVVLSENESEWSSLKEGLDKNNIQSIELSHCTDSSVFKKIKEISPNTYFSGSGKILEFKDLD
ncbi:hypothetical protein JXR93_03455 [bacterium]|nr:hypothetical protein [bacterium]